MLGALGRSVCDPVAIQSLAEYRQAAATILRTL